MVDELSPQGQAGCDALEVVGHKDSCRRRVVRLPGPSGSSLLKLTTLHVILFAPPLLTPKEAAGTWHHLGRAEASHAYRTWQGKKQAPLPHKPKALSSKLRSAGVRQMNCRECSTAEATPSAKKDWGGRDRGTVQQLLPTLNKALNSTPRIGRWWANRFPKLAERVCLPTEQELSSRPGRESDTMS